MAFQIRTNVDALNVYNALAKVNAETAKAQLRLATGKRINSVADDTSGYNVGRSLTTKSEVMKAAQGNISAAKNLLSTAESALQQIDNLATQIKAKIVDNADPTKDHIALGKDINALANEIGAILENTNFNGTALLSGAGSFSFQTGLTADGNTAETLSLDYASSLTSVSSFTSSGSLVTIGDDATTKTNIAGISTSVDNLIANVKSALGSIGNSIQRLDSKNDYLTSAIANATASMSRLFDADLAMEQLNATKGQILGQAATAMLAQVNVAPQNILQLFA